MGDKIHCPHSLKKKKKKKNLPDQLKLIWGLRVCSLIANLWSWQQTYRTCIYQEVYFYHGSAKNKTLRGKFGSLENAHLNLLSPKQAHWSTQQRDILGQYGVKEWLQNQWLFESKHLYVRVALRLTWKHPNCKNCQGLETWGVKR